MHRYTNALAIGGIRQSGQAQNLVTADVEAPIDHHCCVQIDLVSIIFNIAAGVALLPIASFVTEFVMLYVLPGVTWIAVSMSDSPHCAPQSASTTHITSMKRHQTTGVSSTLLMQHVIVPSCSDLDERRARMEAEEERRREEQSAVDFDALFSQEEDALP